MTIIGHHRQQQILDSHIATNKLSHAYLFSGPEHVGKMPVALEFAKKLLPGAAHPDLTVLDSDTIGINDIRALKDRAGRTAFGNGYKIFILSDASSMSREAANSLLKLLEEPLGQAIFILIAGNNGLVLPTILSRVYQLKFWPVSEHLLKQALIDENIDPARAALLAEISFGRPGLALAKREEPEATLKQEVERLEAEFAKSILGPINERFVFAEKISKDFEAYTKWYNETAALLRLLMHRGLGVKGGSGVLAKIQMPLLQAAASLQSLMGRHPYMQRPYTNKKLLMETALFSVHSA